MRKSLRHLYGYQSLRHLYIYLRQSLLPSDKLRNSFFLNPQRKKNLTFRTRIKNLIQLGFIKFGLWCGFQNIEYTYVHGAMDRVKIGKNCSTLNAFYNVMSGDIRIGDNTIFGHGCMLVTGTHNFYDGMRGALHEPPIQETPGEGRDIEIGSGCFIGSGAIILGNVKIGDNVIIGAGAVVHKDIPSNCFAAGVPAKVIRCFDKPHEIDPVDGLTQSKGDPNAV